jgi:broad specificity phosphatase PhoE
MNSGLPEEERIVGDPAGGNPVTDAGRAQALRLAPVLQARLQEGGPDVIACSRAERAIETCRLALPDAEYVSTPCLDEMSKGDWEGRRVGHVVSPEVREELERLGWDFRPPGGESREDVCNRVMPFIREIIDNGFTQAVLFTHLNLIRSVAAVALGVERACAYTLSVPNSSLYILRHDGEWENHLEFWEPSDDGYRRSELVQRDGRLVEAS